MTTRPWAVVAGGSGGLGRACAAALARDGWNTVLTYRSNTAGAEKTASLVSEAGGEAIVKPVDLADPDSVRGLVADVTAAVPVSGLVYAAGPHIPMAFIADTPPEQFGHSIDQDLKAAYNLVQLFLPALRETKGAITAIVTPVIVRYTRTDLLSSAPKAGVQALIRGVAAEEGRYGVRANCVGVGVIEGEGLWETLTETGVFTERGLKQALAAIPLGHFGSPDDVGRTVRFLMSDEARWITGQTLNVDGGYSV